MKRVCWAALTVCFAGCVPKPAPPPSAAPPPPPVTVTVAPVETRAVNRSVTVVGTLAGTEEVPIAPKVDGRVLAIHADLGDVVLPGAILMELDPADLILDVEAARRSLEAELARLGLTELPSEEFSIDEVPSVRRTAIALSSAQLEYDRAKRLVSTGASSQREYDTAETDFRAAEANLKDALTRARATLADARLKQAMLASAEQRLADATIRVPVPTSWPAWAAVMGVAGTPLRYAVSHRLVSEGEMIRSNPVTITFRLVLDYKLKLQAAIPEQYAGEVRVGQPVTVRVDAYPGEAFPGQITRLNPTVDPTTRTFNTEVSVPNLAGHLRAGGFARGTVATRTDSGVLTVPPAALVTFAGVTKVFVIENNTARAVEVIVGVRDKNWLEVRGSALTPGQMVATSGFTQLVDGSAVIVRAVPTTP